jgi:hypothetical protein
MALPDGTVTRTRALCSLVRLRPSPRASTVLGLACFVSELTRDRTGPRSTSRSTPAEARSLTLLSYK